MWVHISLAEGLFTRGSKQNITKNIRGREAATAVKRRKRYFCKWQRGKLENEITFPKCSTLKNCSPLFPVCLRIVT